MDRIRIGKVLKPQGLKGELKVGCTNAKDYLAITKLYMMGREYDICKIRANGDQLYVMIAGIDSIEDAELFRGQNVFALREEIKLDEGEYFIDDLIGCEVLDNESNIYGTIKKIDNYGSKDVYTLDCEGVEHLFACVEHLIIKVDYQEKRVIVDKEILRSVML